MNALFLLVLVQMITEMLPISSSGHVDLAQYLLDFFSTTPVQFTSILDDAAHISALCVHLIFFTWLYRRIFKYLIFFKITRSSFKRLFDIFIHTLGLIIIVDIITIFAYYLRSFCSNTLFFNNLNTPAIMLAMLFSGFCLTTLALLFLSKLTSTTTSTISYRCATMLGLTQSTCLLLPGLSRFALTYTMLRLYKIRPDRAFQTTFITFIPLVGAISLRGLRKGGLDALYDIGMSPVLYCTTTIVALLLFFWMYQLARTQKLWYCAWYLPLPIITTLTLIVYH